MIIENTVTFDAKPKVKWLTPPKSTLNLKFDVALDDGGDGKDGSAITKYFLDLFKKDVTAAVDEVIKGLRKQFEVAIEETEKTYQKKYHQAFLNAPDQNAVKTVMAEFDEFVDTANIMIRKGVEAAEQTIGKCAEKVYARALAAVEKKFKTKLGKQKVKYAFKIVAFVGLALVGAALTVGAAAGTLTATVLSAGAAAPTILAAVALGAATFAAIIALVRAVRTDHKKIWPTQKKELAELEARIKLLGHDLAKEREKALDGNLSVSEQISIARLRTEKQRAAVLKQAEKAKNYILAGAKQVDKRVKELQALDVKLADIRGKMGKGGSDGKVYEKQVADLENRQENLKLSKEKWLKEVSAIFKIVQDAEKVANSPDTGIQEHLGVAQKIGVAIAVIDELWTTVEARAEKLADGISKASKDFKAVPGAA